MKKIFTVRLLFIAAIIALCSFSFLSYKRIEWLMLSSEMVTHTTQVKLELEKLVSTLKDAEAGHRGYLLTHDPRFLESFNKGLQGYPQCISSLKKLTEDNIEQQKNLDQVEALTVRRVNYMFNILRIDKTHTPSAEQILGGKQIMDSLHTAITKMEDVENSLLQVRNAELARESSIAPVWLLFFTLTSLAILVATFLAIIRQIKARKKTEESEKELQRLFSRAPVTIVVYRGENFIVEVANIFALEMWGKTEAEVIGKPFFEISPELMEMQEPLLKKVLQTGEPFIGKEVPAQYTRNGERHSGYFDFVYRPTYNSKNKITGIIAIGTEVTYSVLSRKKIEESETNYRLLSHSLEQKVEQRTAELLERNLFTQTLLDSSVDLIIVVDKELRYISLNRRALDAYQHIFQGEIIGKKIDELTPGLKQHPAFVEMMKAFAGEPIHHREYRAGIGDKFFDLDHIPIRNETGIYAVMTIMRDVTENVRAKKEIEKVNQHLQHRNEFIETIIDASHEWIAVWDKNLNLLTINRAVEQVLGSTREQLAGKHLFDIYPNTKGTRTESDLVMALNGESVKNEPFHSAITGKYVQNYITPLKDDDGNIYAALAIAHDITDIKKAEEEIKRSQRHFSQLFNVSPVAMSLSYVDNGQVVNVNEAWEKMFLLNRKDVIGKKTSELNLTDPDERAENVARVLSAGGSFPALEMKYHLGNGKIIYAFVSVESVELDGMKCFLSAYFDVSERRQAEEKIKETNELLANKNADFMEAQRLAHIGSWEWDIVEDKVSWTDELYRIFGVSPEKFEATFENYIALLHPDDREFAANIVQHAYQAHQPFDFMHRTIRPDGTLRILHGRGKVLLNERQEPIKMFGTAQDLTELKQYEAAIEQKNRELENMNSELSSFAYVASHDLQEPLRKIQVLSKRIVEKEIRGLSADGRECFTRMENAANRMQQLINDLLSYSRTAVGEKLFELTDLNHLLQQVTTDLHEKIASASAVIETGELPKLNVVPFQFKQLFTNLISNSIKFSKPGVAPHIKIESRLTDKLNGAAVSNHKYYHISIIDNGIGFENEYKDQIFGLFSRLHGRSEYEGTGIGLSICKRIIENHNGIITADGEPAQGATFNIYLPLS